MRVKLLLLLVLIVLCSLATNAQDNPDTTYWKKDFQVGLSFNQASFSSNWTGGGVNSIGLNAMLNYKANYKRSIHSWDNEINLAYGVLKNADQGSRKSIDVLYLDSKYGRAISEKWNMFGSVNFLSQFADGFSYDVEFPNGEVRDSLISKIFAPAFLTFAWGMEYHPTKFFNLRLSPFAPRFTFVSDDRLSDLGAYGVDPGDKIRTELLAFQALANFEKKISDNLLFKWKYMLFLNYENLEFEQWDHRLDLLLSAQVSKHISVNLGGIMVYDFDQDDEVQLNQFFNFGLVYSAKNYEDEK